MSSSATIDKVAKSSSYPIIDRDEKIGLYRRGIDELIDIVCFAPFSEKKLNEFLQDDLLASDMQEILRLVSLVKSAAEGSAEISLLEAIRALASKLNTIFDFTHPDEDNPDRLIEFPKGTILENITSYINYKKGNRETRIRFDCKLPTIVMYKLIRDHVPKLKPRIIMNTGIGGPNLNAHIALVIPFSDNLDDTFGLIRVDFDGSKEAKVYHRKYGLDTLGISLIPEPENNQSSHVYRVIDATYLISAAMQNLLTELYADCPTSVRIFLNRVAGIKEENSLRPREVELVDSYVDSLEIFYDGISKDLENRERLKRERR